MKITGDALILLGELCESDSEQWSGMAASHEGVWAEPWPRQGAEQVVSGKDLPVSLLQY